MLSRQAAFMLWAVYSCLIAAGCDPVRATRQTLWVRVTDSESGNPIAGATVQIKYDFDRGEAELEKTEQVSDSRREEARKFWETWDWSSGVTHNDGQAEIASNVTELDWERGSTPPPSRDEFTGKPYFVKVQRGRDDPEEILQVRMNAGEVAKGTSYSVMVIKIEEPQYVEIPHNQYVEPRIR
jgi:hypothetical protein